MKAIYLTPVGISFWGEDTLCSETKAFCTYKAAETYAKELYSQLEETHGLEPEDIIEVVPLVEE